MPACGTEGIGVPMGYSSSVGGSLSDAEWESGDVVSLSLEEFPADFTPRAFDRRRNNADNPA